MKFIKIKYVLLAVLFAQTIYGNMSLGNALSSHAETKRYNLNNFSFGFVVDAEVLDEEDERCESFEAAHAMYVATSFVPSCHLSSSFYSSGLPYTHSAQAVPIFIKLLKLSI